MNLIHNTAIDLGQLEEDARRSQATVLNLVDREAQILERLEDLAAREDDERRNGSVETVLECEALINIHKSLKEQINRVQKRLEKVVDDVKADLGKEVKKEDGLIETESFTLKDVPNQPSVIVDELKSIPKRFRNEPAPVPFWKKWPADKNAIKKALKKGEKIKGVHLEVKHRLEIKRK